MNKYKHILVETHGAVGLVRLNRPQALNALNSELLSEVMAALTEFDKNPAIGALIITGNERAFAAGADIKEMMNATAIEMLQRDFISTFDTILTIKKPLIAAVSGWCLVWEAETN